MVFPSPFKKGIIRLLQTGDRHSVYELEGPASKRDFEAIVWALKQLSPKSPQLADQLYGLSVLLQNSPTQISSEATRLLAERFNWLSDDEERAKLFVLKVLVLTETEVGTDALIAAARRGLASGDPFWGFVLTQYAGHPYKQKLLDSLRRPLPEGEIARGLFFLSNLLPEVPHPFDGVEGYQQLLAWAIKPEMAVEVLSCIPRLSDQLVIGQLLGQLGQASDIEVQIAVAGAQASLGDAGASDRLVGWLQDPRCFTRSAEHLRDLGKGQLIPQLTNAFRAQVDFSDWLAFPTELGRIPDQLTTLDERVLYWPPEAADRRLWLIEFQSKHPSGLGEPQRGRGLVGSRTFCLFSYDAHRRPPNDAYALHCVWELCQFTEHAQLSEDEECELFALWPGLESPKDCLVLKLSESLGLGTNRLELVEVGDGWVVLDPSGSRFYPASEQPDKCNPIPIIYIHAGLKLLRLEEPVDRLDYLQPIVQNQLSDGETIAAFHKFMQTSSSFDGMEFFDDYVKALINSNQTQLLSERLPQWEACWDHPRGLGILSKAALHCGLFTEAERLLLKLRDTYADYQRSEEMSLLARLWASQGRRDEAISLLKDCLSRLVEEGRRHGDPSQYERWYQNHRITFLEIFPEEAPPAASVAG